MSYKYKENLQNEDFTEIFEKFAYSCHALRTIDVGHKYTKQFFSRNKKSVSLEMCYVMPNRSVLKSCRDWEIS